MYGVGAVATQRSTGKRTPRHREQSAEEKRRGLKEKLFAYVKRQLNPQLEESLEPAPRSSAARLELAALERDTRFTRSEIKLIYRGFKQECPSGEVDEESFRNIFSQFFPLGDASQYASLVFNTIKEKDSDKISFERFLSALSVWGRGSRAQKLSVVFSLYDADGDGRVSRGELLAVTRAVHLLLEPGEPDHAAQHVDRIFPLMDADRDGAVSREELSRWVSQHPALLKSLDHTDTVL